jgi:hypothetical protein
LHHIEADRLDVSQKVWIEPPIIAISVWFGGDPPSYIWEFFNTITKNPNITLLVPAVTKSRGICGDDEGVFYAKNIKIVCMTREKMIRLFAEKMCKVWECDEEELEMIFAEFTK